MGEEERAHPQCDELQTASTITANGIIITSTTDNNNNNNNNALAAKKTSHEEVVNAGAGLGVLPVVLKR